MSVCHLLTEQVLRIQARRSMLARGNGVVTVIAEVGYLERLVGFVPGEQSLQGLAGRELLPREGEYAQSAELWPDSMAQLARV